MLSKEYFVKTKQDQRNNIDKNKKSILNYTIFVSCLTIIGIVTTIVAHVYFSTLVLVMFFVMTWIIYYCSSRALNKILNKFQKEVDQIEKEYNEKLSNLYGITQ